VAVEVAASVLWQRQILQLSEYLCSGVAAAADLGGGTSQRWRATGPGDQLAAGKRGAGVLA
jgi:hypothetical protein